MEELRSLGIGEEEENKYKEMIETIKCYEYKGNLT